MDFISILIFSFFILLLLKLNIRATLWIVLIFSLLFYFFNINKSDLHLVSVLIICTVISFSLLLNPNIDEEFLIICALLGSIILILSSNFIEFYLGLELQTFSLFILIASKKLSVKSSEGGLKYFILGAISSGFVLLGISIFFYCNKSILITDTIFKISDNYFLEIGKLFIICSLFFKLSLFPFHFWIPDIYEASKLNVLSLIGTLPKLSIIIFFIKLNLYNNILFWCGLLSLIIGALGALNQTKIKRLIAYSGISHMGLIILGISFFNNINISSSLIYIFIYISIFLSILLVMFYLNLNDNYIFEISQALYWSNILSFSLALFILSIGGLPPLSGFISKWFIILNIFNNGYNLLCFFIVIISAISIGFYLRLIKILYFQKLSSYITWTRILTIQHKSNYINYIIGLLFFLVLFIVVNLNPIIIWVNYLSSFF